MARFDVPQQCKGITRRGTRCSISSRSSIVGNDGRDLALPLKLGCDYCLAHLPVLVPMPCFVRDALILYLDFETSGLDIFSDYIVEFGVLSEKG